MMTIDQTVSLLRQGGVVLLPTDTVWGVAAAVSSDKGITRLYQLKQRHHKPTALLVSQLTMAEKYGQFGPRQKTVAGNYWPGALTLIVPAKATVPPGICGSSGVGIRWPNHPVATAVITQLGCPVVASSANFAGELAPDRFDQIEPELLSLVDGVVAGADGQGLASTVIDTTQNPWITLRQGAVRVQ